MSDEEAAARRRMSMQLDLIEWILAGDHTVQDLRAALLTVEQTLRQQLHQTTSVEVRRKIERALGIVR